MKHLATILAAILLSFASLAQADTNTATITFAAPTARVDGAAITGVLTYNVYQGIGTGTTKTKVGTITATSTTINTGLLSGTTYCYAITAVEGSGPESAMSNEGCKTFAASPPGVVTITVR